MCSIVFICVIALAEFSSRSVSSEGQFAFINNKKVLKSPITSSNNVAIQTKPHISVASETGTTRSPSFNITTTDRPDYVLPKPHFVKFENTFTKKSSSYPEILNYTNRPPAANTLKTRNNYPSRSPANFQIDEKPSPPNDIQTILSQNNKTDKPNSRTKRALDKNNNSKTYNKNEHSVGDRNPTDKKKRIPQRRNINKYVEVLQTIKPTATAATPATTPRTNGKKNINKHDYYLDYEDMPFDSSGGIDYLSSDSSDSSSSSDEFKRTRRKPYRKYKRPLDSENDSESVEESSFSESISSLFNAFANALSALPKYANVGGKKILASFYTTTPRSYHKPTYSDDFEDEENSPGNRILNNLFGNWRDGYIDDSQETTPSSIGATTRKSTWLGNWFTDDDDDDDSAFEAVNQNDGEDEDDNGNNWFFGWLESGNKNGKNLSKSIAADRPQAPPIDNSQLLIGLLAQHIIAHNYTISTTTEMPHKSDNQLVYSAYASKYAKYQVWRLKPMTKDDVKALAEYQKSAEGEKLIWFTSPSLRGFTDILVPPKQKAVLQNTLLENEISHEILLFDMGMAINFEQRKFNELERAKLREKFGHTMTWRNYHQYSDIVEYLEYLQHRYPNYVQLISVGRSFEGRPLIVVKVKDKQFHGKAHRKKEGTAKWRQPYEENAVFLEAGSHGREWIGPAASTCLLKEILKTMRSNSTSYVTNSVRGKIWYILPVLNPDGYEYSHEHDRLWHKTRSKHYSKRSSTGIIDSAINWFQPETGKICYGVDPNRNWAYREHTMSSSCSEYFSGHRAFSEPETRAVSNFLMEHRRDIGLFMSLHSYGQRVYFPLTKNISYHRYDELFDLAMVGTESLKNSGSMMRYTVDTSQDNPRYGSSEYFAHYEAGIPFSYTVQLADTGAHGFLLPASHIEATTKDLFQMIKSILEFI